MSEGSALEAAELFSQGKFSESAAVWRKLQTSEEADPRIAHNLAVTEFCAGNCRDIDGFFQKLKELSNGVEDSAKHVEKSTKDHIIFNEAAVKFQMKMFGASWALLESLFQGIESVDDDLAYKVCFLLIDIFLFQKQTGKAEEILLELTKLAERFQPSPLSFDEATFGDLLQVPPFLPWPSMLRCQPRTGSPYCPHNLPSLPECSISVLLDVNPSDLLFLDWLWFPLARLTSHSFTS